MSKTKKETDEEIEFLKSMNFRNWAEKAESRIRILEVQKIVDTERSLINSQQQEFKQLEDYQLNFNK